MTQRIVEDIIAARASVEERMRDAVPVGSRPNPKG
jgi:hypothetical protein